MRPSFAGGHVALLAAALAVVPDDGTVRAQSWAQVASDSPIVFGATGELVAADASGLVAFDEAAGKTRLPGTGGWIGLVAAPGQLHHATIAASGGFVYLWNGAAGPGATNDLWRFDRATNDWIQRPPTSLVPAPRVGARAAAIAGAIPLLVFGGSTATGWPNDSWVVFDSVAGVSWTQVPTAPGLLGRTGHAMAPGPGQSVVLFGGQRTQPLGDTWVFRGAAWSQRAGSSPPAAAGCRMAFAADRDVTVLVHPNGETWEWNDFVWRRVGVTASPQWRSPAVVADPAHGGAVLALQNEGAALATYQFTPSPASYEVTLDQVCVANGVDALELSAFERSLPILGQSLHLRATGLLPSGLFVGAFEPSIGPPSSAPIRCGCAIALAGVGTMTQFVPGAGTVRDWLLPIPLLPALVGVPIDVQGLVVDVAAPCWLMTTQGGTLIPGP